MSTKGVTWSSPFGSSALGNLYNDSSGFGNPIQGAIDTQGISTNHLFGNSSLGVALEGNPFATLTTDGKSKANGSQVLTQSNGGSATGQPNTTGGVGLNAWVPATQQAAPNGGQMSTPPPLTAGAPASNTTGEDGLRLSYLNALNPNYGFTFNNTSSQNSNKFK